MRVWQRVGRRHHEEHPRHNAQRVEKGCQKYLCIRQQLPELVIVSLPKQQNQDILIAQDSDISVQGISGGKEHGLCPRGDECLSDLVRDKAALSDPGEAYDSFAVHARLCEGLDLLVVDFVPKVIDVSPLLLEEGSDGAKAEFARVDRKRTSVAVAVG